MLRCRLLQRLTASPNPHASPVLARREELKARFPDKPWVDVLSKADLLEEELFEADELLRRSAQQQQQQQQGAPQAGGGQQEQQDQKGVAQKQHTAASSKYQQQEQVGNDEQQGQPAAAAPRHAGQHAAQQHRVTTAAAFAAALPAALRVSSTSGEGIDSLKLSMLAMLEQYQLWKHSGEEAGEEQQPQDGAGDAWE